MLALLLTFLGSLCRKPVYKPEIVNISNDACLSERPCIARSSDGRLAIGWTGSKTGYEDIWVVEKAPGGNWSAPENISNAGSANGSRNVSLDYDADGVLHAAWSQYAQIGPSGGWTIAYTKRPVGHTWATAETISYGTAIRPHIAVDAAGIVHLEFEDLSGERSTICYASRAVGGGWAAVTEISQRFSSADASLSVLADGTALAAWEDWSSRPVTVSWSLRGDSGTWSQPASVYSSPGYCLSPRMASNGRRVALAFGASDVRASVVIMTFDAATGWSSPDTSCTVHIPGHLSVALDSLGCVYLAWGNEPELRVARRDGLWNQIAVSDSLMTLGTSLVVDCIGHAHVAWRSRPVFEDPGEVFYSEVAIATERR